MLKTSYDHFVLVICVYLIARTCTGHGFTEEQKEYIDHYIEETIGCRNVAGLNIALIKDGRIAYLRGYGVKDTETREPVDPDGNTVFCVASNTKAFTSTLIAKLLSEGQYPRYWNTPVREILGDAFQLNHDYLTQHVTLKDLLAHKVGLAKYDALWFPSAISKDQLIRSLRHASSIVGFRDAFTYSNILYSVAARAAERMGGGLPWQELVRKHFLLPLNMTNSHFISDPKFSDQADHAQPYITYNNSLKRVDVRAMQRPADLGDGAVSLCSTAQDMAKWMMFNLGAGKKPSGKQLMEAKWLLETHKPRMSIYLGFNWRAGLKRKHWPVHFNLHSYGLGWILGNYRGHQLIYHGGSLYGYRSWLTLLPDQRAAVFLSWTGDGVLGNLARASISFFLMDMVLGEKPWLNANSSCQFPQPWSKHPNVTVKRNTINKTIASHRPLTEYTGMYYHELFGNMTVSLTEVPLETAEGNNSTAENVTCTALLIKYGHLHIMGYPSGKKDIFSGHTTGELWFMWSSDQVSLYGVMKIYFSNSTASGTIDRIRIPYMEPHAHPTFSKHPPQEPLAEPVVSHQGIEKPCATQSVTYKTSSSAVSIPSFVTLIVTLCIITIFRVRNTIDVIC